MTEQVDGDTSASRRKSHIENRPRPSDISIVVPTLNCAQELQRLLASVKASWGDDLDLIVVDSYSIDSTIDVARRFRATVLLSESGRSEARNVGWRESSKPFVLFLDSDMIVTTAVLTGCLERARSFDAIIIPEEVMAERSWWGKVRAFERSASDNVPLLEAPRFFLRDTIESLGGYDKSLIGLEDVDLYIRAMASGWKVGRIEAQLIHIETNLSLKAYLRKRSYYGSTDQRFKQKHPQEWKYLTSPRTRLVPVLRRARLEPSLGTAALVCSIGFMRAAELIVRRRSGLSHARARLKWRNEH